MKLTRLRNRPNRSPIIEVEKDFLFSSMMLVHIERLPQVVVLAKQSWAMSDSFDALFTYKGRRFYMGIPFGCIMIEARDARAPRELLEEIAAHVDAYRPVWPTQFIWALARYFFLPFRVADPHTKRRV